MGRATQVGIAIVATPAVRTDIDLDSISVEEEFLLQLGLPPGAILRQRLHHFWSIDILAAARLQDMVPAVYRIFDRPRDGLPQFPSRPLFQLEVGFPESQLDASLLPLPGRPGAVAGDRVETVASFMDRFGLGASTPTYALQLWAPVALCLAGSLWTQVALEDALVPKLKCRLELVDAGIVPQRVVAQISDRLEQLHHHAAEGNTRMDELLTSSARMEMLANDLARWSTQLAHVPQVQQEFVAIQSHVLWLRKVAILADRNARYEHILAPISRLAAWKGRSVEGLCGRFAYKSTHLVQVVMHSKLLRWGKQLRASLYHSLKIVMPPEIADAYIRDLDAAPIPHPATVSRIQLSVDTAFMLYWRDLHTGFLANAGGALYVLSDSSPQGGKDWQISEEYLVVWALLASSTKRAAGCGCGWAAGFWAVSRIEEIGGKIRFRGF